MAKYTSGRQKNLKIGISSYSENLTSLEVIGNVGIGTTNATSKLTVSGNVNVTGVITATSFVGSALSISGISTLGVTSTTNLTSQQLNVSGIVTASTFRVGTAVTINSSGITVVGVITATSFSGSGSGLTSIPSDQLSGALPAIDGSALTGVTASGTGIVIRDDGSPVGTAGTIDFGANLSVTFASGIATITATTAGIVTFVDNAGIATNLKGGVVGNIPYQSAANTTAFLTNGGSGTILQSNGVGNIPTWVAAAPAGAVSGLVIRDSNNNIVGTSGSISQLTFSTGLSVTGTAGVAGIATITLSSNLVGSALSISGISTLGVTSTTNLTSQQLNVSGIATASTFRVGTAVTINASGITVVGVITATSFSGSGANLTGVGGGSTVADDATTNATFYPIFTQTTSGTITASNVSTTKLNFNPSTGTLSATQFTSLSDGTQKTNIRPVENATYIVSQMNGVYYDWIDGHNTGSVGVIAQEMEQVLPEVVSTNDQGLKTVSYGNIVGVLIEAIKEQQVRIEELERKLNA